MFMKDSGLAELGYFCKLHMDPNSQYIRVIVDHAVEDSSNTFKYKMAEFKDNFDFELKVVEDISMWRKELELPEDQ